MEWFRIGIEISEISGKFLIGYFWKLPRPIPTHKWTHVLLHRTSEENHKKPYYICAQFRKFRGGRFVIVQKVPLLSERPSYILEVCLIRPGHIYNMVFCDYNDINCFTIRFTANLIRALAQTYYRRTWQKHIAAKTLSIKSTDLLIFIFNTVFFTSNALC